MVSAATGAPLARSRAPTHSSEATWPRRATSVSTPASLPAVDIGRREVAPDPVEALARKPEVLGLVSCVEQSHLFDRRVWRAPPLRMGRTRHDPRPGPSPRARLRLDG